MGSRTSYADHHKLVQLWHKSHYFPSHKTNKPTNLRKSNHHITLLPCPKKSLGKKIILPKHLKYWGRGGSPAGIPQAKMSWFVYRARLKLCYKYGAN